MKVWGNIQMDFRGREAKRRGKRFIEDYILEQAELVEKIARRNVSPGRGPGPHPHRTPHEDTGRLEESIEVDVDVRGSRVVAEVVTDVPYGTFLEVGWHARSGKFYRYPWLAPALAEAGRRAQKVAQRHARVWFVGDLTGGPQVVPAGWVPPGIRWDPGVMRFRGPGGRFVSRDTFERALAEFHARMGTP